MNSSPRTVVDFLRVTQQHLAKKGFENSRLEAELLLSYILGLDRVGLYLQFDRPLLPEEIGRYRFMLLQRLNHKPLQWIIEHTEFFGIELRLRPGVFIPRPETELLAEVTVHHLMQWVQDYEGNEKRIRLLDIGTGSGAIALAIAKALPELIVHGCDISPVALELTKLNAEKLSLLDRTLFERWDVLDFRIPAVFETPYHWITMNPPYVPSSDWDQLPQEVKAEPKQALDGGEDGLEFYRRLVELLPDILLKEGGVSLEVGVGQAEDVMKFYRDEFNKIECIPDLAGIDRVVCGTGFKGQ